MTARRGLSRRMFLRGTLGAAVLLGVGGFFAGRWRSRGRRAPRRPLAFFSPAEFAVMTAIAETLLPGAGGRHAAFDEMETVERIDAKLAGLPAHETKDVKSLLWVLEHLPPLLGPRLGFFTGLTDAGRAAYLGGWERSRFAFKRTGYAALKYLVMLHYWGDRRSWPAIGYLPMGLPQWREGT